MNILYNKGNVCIIDGETEIQCYSYNTLVAIYNKVMNNYTFITGYVLHGEEKPMSATSKKHQNIFRRDFIPANANQI